MRIRAVDETGAAFPNVLIIVRSVSSGKEHARYLSDFKGETPDIEIDDGISQVIATCPYGICETAIREFLASTTPSVLVLPLSVRATDKIGELIGARIANIVFRDQSKAGVSSGVSIFVRDSDAVRQKWYKTDENGRVSIQVLGEGTNIVIAFANVIYRYVLSDKCPPASTSNEAPCVIIQHGQILLDTSVR